jgi:hypothetical protein
MTKANSLDPPRLATWLLEQFSPVLDVPLAGDLIESFREGRSSGWYWRQVLWAVLVAFLHSLQKQSGRLVYAVVCGGFIAATWSSMFNVANTGYVREMLLVDGQARMYWLHPPQETGPSSALLAVHTLYAKSYGIEWPWSVVYQIAFQTVFQAVIIVLALCAYFGFAQVFKVQNVSRALMLVVVALASGNVAATFLNGSPLASGFPFVMNLLQLVAWVLMSGPEILGLIMALLVGMWMVDPRSTARPVPA